VIRLTRRPRRCRIRGNEQEAHAGAPAGRLPGVHMVVEVVPGGSARDRIDRARAKHRSHLAVSLHVDDVRRVHRTVQDGTRAGDDLPVVEYVVVAGEGVYFGRIGTYDPIIRQRILMQRINIRNTITGMRS
jgi:hypothetical protein